MAFTNEQKLVYIREMFKRRLDEVATLSEMVQLINNISPTVIKNFLLSKLEEVRQERLIYETREGELASDLEALKTDVSGI